MSQTKSISDESVKIIEDALTTVRDNPTYRKTDTNVEKEPTVFEAFVNAIIDSAKTKVVDELNDKFTANKTVAIFGVNEHIAMALLGVDSTVAHELFMPKRGSFDWNKTDWINKDTEVEEYVKHVERTISRYFNYRIFYGRAEKANQ